jgi:hypothetical protein
VGILIVAAVLLFLFLRNKTGPTGGGPEEQPQPESYLETCMKEDVFEAIDLISMQGGYRNPSFYKEYQFTGEPGFTNIAYLCYTPNYYSRCINQNPVFMTHLKNELAAEINGTVRACWNKFGQSLETAGYVVEGLYQGFNLSFTQTKAIIDIRGQLTMTKNNETTIEKDIKVNIPTAYYKIGDLVNTIVGQEALHCSFQSLGYMVLHPGIWRINETKTSDSIKIYTIEHKKTKERFRFAIRGCVIPPGF